MLNVEEEYLSNSHSFIFPLLSGVHLNGNSDGRLGVASRGGHEHVLLEVLQDPSASWRVEFCVMLLSLDGKDFKVEERLA